MSDTPETPGDGRAPGPDDWSPGRLDELAPQVDVAAARVALDRARQRGRTRRTSVLVGAAVVVAIGVIGAVGLGRDRTEDLATVPPDDTTTSTTTSAPAATGPVSGDPGFGTDSPLVGLTELEVRETYPWVETVWQDGVAFNTTADIQPGRVRLAVERGIVIGAAADCPAGVPLVGWASQACHPGPDDGPTVWGKLIPGDRETDGAIPGNTGALRLEPGFNADRYFEGLLVGPSNTGGAPVHDMSGAEVAVGDLRAEDVVYLWIHDGCRESSPVQCTINAIVVDRS